MLRAQISELYQSTHKKLKTSISRRTNSLGLQWLQSRDTNAWNANRRIPPDLASIEKFAKYLTDCQLFRLNSLDRISNKKRSYNNTGHIYPTDIWKICSSFLLKSVRRLECCNERGEVGGRVRRTSGESWDLWVPLTCPFSLSSDPFSFVPPEKWGEKIVKESDKLSIFIVYTNGSENRKIGLGNTLQNIGNFF